MRDKGRISGYADTPGLLTEEQEQMFKANMKLVPYFVHQTGHAPFEFEDACQIGYLGLAKAVKTYDSTRSSFATHAYWNIKQALTYQQRLYKSKKRVGMTCTLSLDAIMEDNMTGEPVMYRFDGTTPISVEEATERTDEAEHVRAALERIDPKVRVLVTMHYGDELSFTEIGKRLGVSRNSVSQRVRQALEQMRGTLARGGGA